MSRLQSVLVLILGVLVAVVFGRIAWGLLGPLAAATLAFAQSVPGWVWWTVLGSLWWMPWMFGKRSCRRSSCSTSHA